MTIEVAVRVLRIYKDDFDILISEPVYLVSSSREKALREGEGKKCFYMYEEVERHCEGLEEALSSLLECDNSYFSVEWEIRLTDDQLKDFYRVTAERKSMGFSLSRKLVINQMLCAVESEGKNEGNTGDDNGQ